MLCRLRTGHCYFSHSFLLRNEDPPSCVCGARKSVRHVLLECRDLGDVRRKYYTASTIKTLFRDVPPDSVFKFLKELKLFDSV